VAILENGDRTEVLGSLVPEMVATELNFDWQNFRRQLMAAGSQHQRILFGAYVCRTFNRSSPVPMRMFDLTLHGQRVRDPDQPPSEERIRHVFHLPCTGETEEEPDGSRAGDLGPAG
jgi:hypothetical protein